MHWDVGLHMVDLAGPGKVNPRGNDKIKNVVCPLFYCPLFYYFTSKLNHGGQFFVDHPVNADEGMLFHI